MQLKATFANHDRALWPGQFVDVRLQLETRRNAVTVPPAAVQRGPQGEFVFVVAPDGTAQMRTVRLSTSNPGGAAALVDAGVAAGERVVTDGQLKVRAGAHVRVVQAGADAPATASPPARAGADANATAATSEHPPVPAARLARASTATTARAP